MRPHPDAGWWARGPRSTAIAPALGADLAGLHGVRTRELRAAGHPAGGDRAARRVPVGLPPTLSMWSGAACRRGVGSISGPGRRGRDGPVPDPHLRSRGAVRAGHAGGPRPGHAGAQRLRRTGRAARCQAAGRRGPATDRDGDLRARRDRGDRRSLRRDEGGARRLLPGRRPRPGHRADHRQAVPGALRWRRGPSGHDLRLRRRGPQAMTAGESSAVAAAVADAHRREWAFVLAATVRVTRDLDVAEECAQEAFAAALTAWRPNGIPTRPGAWLTTAARRRALNVLRHEGVARRYLPLLVEDDTVPGPADRKSTRLNSRHTI